MQRHVHKTYVHKIWLKHFLSLTAACLFAVHSPAFAGDEGEGGDQLSAKLNSYIKCFNSLDGSARKSISRYASWVKDMKSGPTGKESIVYGLYSINGSTITECQGSFSVAGGVKPAIPLDAAAAAYIEALAGLNKVVEDMYPYYDRENYKDDKFAKGRQLHGPFATQAARFEEASRRFASELDEENDRRLEAQMARLEQEQGRKLPYLNMLTMHKAKLLVRLVQRETTDAQPIIPRLDAFEKAADEQSQFAKSNPQGLPTMWSIYANSIEEFRKASKEYMRRVRDKTPYSTGDAMMMKAGSGWMVEGSPDKVIRSYNQMVTYSNGLR